MCTCTICNNTGGFYNGAGRWQKCNGCCGPAPGRPSSRPISTTNCPSCGNAVDVTSKGTLAGHAWHGDGPCPGSYRNAG